MTAGTRPILPRPPAGGPPGGGGDPGEDGERVEPGAGEVVAEGDEVQSAALGEPGERDVVRGLVRGRGLRGVQRDGEVQRARRPRRRCRRR
ncbi:hypothetical protein [Streptomyces albospinus]|uniref:hypothetical protein n=1 Tax=Streptomyces albospinus TaxID=285515 RepID=UPI00166F9161|nr:hypothetical protein [Streptomyces albospinus]